MQRLGTYIIDNADRIVAAWQTAVAPQALLMQEQAKPFVMALAGEVAADAADATVAAVRAALRAVPHFDIEAMHAQLCSLRSAVTTMWLDGEAPLTADSFRELQRLHAAIDRAVGEAIARHALQIERSRSLFLGMLGHDLRTPLGAIALACQYLERPEIPPERRLEAIGRVARSAAAMEGMIRDMLDFARARLGKEMPVAATPGDIGAVCRHALEEACDAHPRCDFRFDIDRGLQADMDAGRMRKVVVNLLNNAAKNGARGMPVLCAARRDGETVRVRVRHCGPVLTAAAMQALFDPIAQLAVADADAEGNPPANLGLDLFIAREIVRAHGGEMTVTCGDGDQTEIAFTLPSLPR